MSTTTPLAIETRGLTKIFRDFWLREKVTAVDALDLDVRPNEVFGLLGPNGSGKSTTIKMILGLLFSTKGQIRVLGHHPAHVKVKQRIGFLPEESDLYPFLDARETLDFYGQLFHLPRKQRQRRIDMLLEMVGLSAVAYRRVGEYSKGMARRIGLAQALINDPDLLILDEPTSGLDPIGTRQFKDLIKMLAERGKTVVLSSHLLGDVEDVCDRVCILYGGKQRAVGTLDELLAVEDQTEIVTPKLTPEQLTAINDILRKSGQETIEVRTPRGRLESLFLDIVTEAQEQRLATGGARAGGQMAEFLSEPAGDDVLQSLIQTKPDLAEPETAETEAPEQPEDKADAPLAEVLAEVQSPRVEEPKPIPVQPAAPRAGGVDRGVLDNLLGDEPAEDA